MTLLLNNEEVDRALTHEDALSATEAMLAEPPTGQAINRPRSETYMPVILPLATGNRWCGLVMLFDLERLGTITLTSRLDDTYTARAYFDPRNLAASSQDGYSLASTHLT